MPTWKGLAASPGVFTGPARVILKPSGIYKLKPGEVLVTKMTTPEWMDAFDRLVDGKGAIVTELGGMMCHAAIVAREYGIPCVVGVANITKNIVSGDQITLNGATGEVSHDPPA